MRGSVRRQSWRWRGVER
ncbi:hypothetical protein Golob_022551 [Gossypium lobatum]|uniref:Uncharacterized protein n=1 Tax=Gossypium lobatum TaxID=34289 RepID=A0A7J8LGV0_9ROSI|nr:hypothetical protein [Gossypium lobatum]